MFAGPWDTSGTKQEMIAAKGMNALHNHKSYIYIHA
jgi:hypothetical protein